MAGNSMIDAARAALARGDLIATYDFARAAHAEGAPDAAYLLVLSLARMGDIESARERYAALGLDAATDIDTRALGARLAKNAAEALGGEAQRRQFLAAGAAYAAIYAETGDVFPGINAASLTLLAGDPGEARRRAEELLDLLPEPADFWTGASRAEALLLLGRGDDACRETAHALTLPGSNLGARATTLRQFELLARFAGIDPGAKVRGLLRPPATAFYCGHMFLCDPVVEAAMAAQIDATFDAHRVGVAFGALACGADIVTAERLLARGGELNVVLPFDVAEFAALSVDPGGPGWLPRFHACLAAATSVRIVSDVRDIGDVHAISYASTVAMGLARLRANELGGTALMLAAWDGEPARGGAGTAVDVARWQSTDQSTVILGPGAVDRRLTAPERTLYDGPARTVMAMIFADVPGFATLAEAEIPAFWRDVMGTAGEVLARHRDVVRSRNSWGDAIFAVVDGVAPAAEIVLSLQEALAAMGTRFTLRIGAHFGPVFETLDPVTGHQTYYGREVSRAARIEPVTPPGRVYVTEAFASAIAMDAPDRFGCHYVGQVPLAKDYGTFPMYRLFRAGPHS